LDDSVKKAVLALKANPAIGDYIQELDMPPIVPYRWPGLQIDIGLGTWDLPYTHTHEDLAPWYRIEIDLASAQRDAQERAGLGDTTLEDIIAHELGHVYANLRGLDSDSTAIWFENASRATHHGGYRSPFNH
jgi:hypothetical protein